MLEYCVSISHTRDVIGDRTSAAGNAVRGLDL
jgi:hypothetical protein